MPDQVKLFVRKNEERRIKEGHLWIFSNEVERLEDPSGNCANGDVVLVYDYKNSFIGSAFYNRNSLIAGRIISRAVIPDIKALLRENLFKAYELRKQCYPEKVSFRLVFSEGDFLPGLIIDKYNNTFVLQVYSSGMQKNISFISEILKEDFGAENIFTKNENYFRRLEGLPESGELLLGEIKSEIINDGSVKYVIDFEGHKTRFYFDQADNRVFTEKIVPGKTALDAFCNSGGFGLHAAKAGASEVTFVDSSSVEIENAKSNYNLNEISVAANFITSDVFDYLEQCISNNKYFDVVMIDPPAFAKNRKSIPQAKKGYEKLNRLALKATEKGGYLVTSSCSHHITKQDFIEILNSAAARNGDQVQLIYFNGASLDHPEIPSMKETSYLKFAILRKL